MQEKGDTSIAFIGISFFLFLCIIIWIIHIVYDSHIYKNGFISPKSFDRYEEPKREYLEVKREQLIMSQAAILQVSFMPPPGIRKARGKKYKWHLLIIRNHPLPLHTYMYLGTDHLQRDVFYEPEISDSQCRPFYILNNRKHYYELPGNFQ